jgi:hypothetical protein
VNLDLVIFNCDGVLVDVLRDAGAAATFDDMRQLPDLVRRMGPN